MLSKEKRVDTYFKQNNYGDLTPKQLRRIKHKEAALTAEVSPMLRKQAHRDVKRADHKRRVEIRNLFRRGR